MNAGIIELIYLIPVIINILKNNLKEVNHVHKLL